MKRFKNILFLNFVLLVISGCGTEKSVERSCNFNPQKPLEDSVLVNRVRDSMDHTLPGKVIDNIQIMQSHSSGEFEAKFGMRITDPDTVKHIVDFGVLDLTLTKNENGCANIGTSWRHLGKQNLKEMTSDSPEKSKS